MWRYIKTNTIIAHDHHTIPGMSLLFGCSSIWASFQVGSKAFQYLCSMLYSLSCFTFTSCRSKCPNPFPVVLTLQHLSLSHGKKAVILTPTCLHTFACTACTGWKSPFAVFAVSRRFIRSSFVNGISLPRLESLECFVSTKEAFSSSSSANS